MGLLDEVRKLAGSFGKAVTEAPRTFGQGVGAALNAPAEYMFNTRNAQIDRQVQDLLNRQASRATKAGDFQKSRRLSNKAASYGEGGAQRLQNLADFSRKNRAKTISGGFRTGLTLVGSGAPAATQLGGLGLGAGLGGLQAGLSGGDLYEGIGRGAGESYKFTGLNRLTSPIFDPMIRGVGGNLLTRTLGRGLIGAGTNLAEDEVYTRIAEGRAPTSGERAFSAGLGALIGQFPGDLKERVEVKQPPSSRSLRAKLQPRTTDNTKWAAKKTRVEWISEAADVSKKDADRIGKIKVRLPGDKGKTTIDKFIKDNPDSAAGVLAGIEYEEDEKGNLKFKFNPTKAALGFAVMGGVKSKPGQAALERLKAGGGEYDLKNLDTTDDVLKLIRNQAKKYDSNIKQARRGKVTFDQTRRQASKLGTKIEDMVKARPGKAYNAEELVAAGDLWKTTSEKAQQITKQYEQAKAAGQDTPLLRAQALEAMNQQALVMTKVLGAESEAGRALNSIKILKQAVENPEGKKLQKIIKRFGGEDNIDKIISRYNQLSMENPEEAYKYLRSINKPNFGDYVTEYWYNSILSSPATHLVNTISNALTTLTSPIERVYTAAVDIPVSKLQGRSRQRYFGEATQDLIGARAGINEGVRKALEILKKGYTTEDVAKLELRRPEAFKGRFGAAVNIPSRALTASDAFFKSINYSAALHAEAYRMAKGNVDEMGKILVDPPSDLIEAAGDIAKYRVFQQEAGQFTKTVSSLRKSINVKGVEPVRFVIPFIETPVNLLKFGFERTPLGAASAVGKQGAQVSDQLGKAFMGSTVAAALALAAAEGKLTGRGPSNKKERDRLYRAGWQPFSIKVGDKWVSYKRLEPFNQTFTQVALAFDEFAQNGNEPVTDKLQNMAVAIGQNLVSQSYLSGLSDVLNALSDPDRYGGNVLERFAGSLIPASSFARFVTRSTDPTLRDPEGLGQAIKANLPGLSKQVPAKLNSFDEPIAFEGGPLRQAFPIYYSTQTGDVENLQRNINKAQNVRDAERAIENNQNPTSVDDKTRNYLEAKNVYYSLKDLDKRDKALAFAELQRQGKITPELEQKLIGISKLDKAGFTKSDMDLLLYDGEYRAQKIIERMGQFTNKENKRKKFAQYVKWGVITPEVEQEIVKLFGK